MPIDRGVRTNRIWDWVPMATAEEASAAAPAEEAAAIATMLVLTAIAERETRLLLSPKMEKLAKNRTSQMANTKGVVRMGPRTCWTCERDAGQAPPHCPATLQPHSDVLLPSLYT
jgi:hypothetical protein